MKHYEIESAEQFIKIAQGITDRYMTDRLDDVYAQIEMLWDRKGGCDCRNCVTSLVSEANQWIRVLVEEKYHDYEGLFFELDDNLSIKKPLWYEHYTECLKNEQDPFRKGEE